MAERLPGTQITSQGQRYLEGLRRKPKRGAGWRGFASVKRRDEIEVVTEQDTPDGQRERITVYEHGEPSVRETIGPATGERPVAVIGGGGTETGEALDMMAANRDRPAQRETKPDVPALFRRQVERRAESGRGRRTFGVPARAWKGER